jgi:hypothetical protein
MVESNLDRRALLTRGLAVSAGIVTASVLASAAGPGPAAAASSEADIPVSLAADRYWYQPAWRWCENCRQLFRSASGVETTAGRCPWGGPHVAGPWNYAVPFAPDPRASLGTHQEGWRWCGNCLSLFFSGFNMGICAAGGSHGYPTSYSYFLFCNNGANGEALANQPGWAWCAQCQVLFYGPHTGYTRCPADGNVHGPNSTHNYQPFVIAR